MERLCTHIEQLEQSFLRCAVPTWSDKETPLCSCVVLEYPRIVCAVVVAVFVLVEEDPELRLGVVVTQK